MLRACGTTDYILGGVTAMKRKPLESPVYRIRRRDNFTKVTVSSNDNIILKLYAKDNKLSKHAMLHVMIAEYIKNEQFNRSNYLKFLYDHINFITKINGVLAAQLKHYQKRFGRLLPPNPK